MEEGQNFQEIRKTNQRGGRCLSVIDLIDDKTLSAEMAAFCWLAIENGADYLTGAVRGGAGKTTLMAALLAFLPEHERIVSIANHSVVEDIQAGEHETPLCMLAHEINHGPWYAYIWGKTARDFFSMTGPGLRRVTCLHADTPNQTSQILQDAGVAPADIQSIDMQLYIRATGSVSKRRRLISAYFRVNDQLMPLYKLDQSRDHFERSYSREKIAEWAAQKWGKDGDDLLAQWCFREQELESMLKQNLRTYRAVRDKIIKTAAR